jgi:hypothetical protein
MESVAFSRSISEVTLARERVADLAPIDRTKLDVGTSPAVTRFTVPHLRTLSISPGNGATNVMTVRMAKQEVRWNPLLDTQKRYLGPLQKPY